MAKTQIKWGNFKFQVNSSQFKGIDSLSLGKSLKYEVQETQGGKSKINVKGYELETVPISYTAAVALGVDPRAEYDAWRSVLGEKNNLYIGGKRWGDSKYILTKANFSVNNMNNQGHIPFAAISLEFAEDYKDTSIKSTAKASQATKTSAVNVGPSKAQKKMLAQGVYHVKN